MRTEQSILHRDGPAFAAVSQSIRSEDYTIYYSTDPGLTVSSILAWVSAQGDRLVDLRVERPSLEERFLEITEAGGQQ